MAFKLFFLLMAPFFVLSLSFSSLAFVDADSNSTSSSDSPETICKSTQYPFFCKSVLPKHTRDVHDSGRFLIQRSSSRSLEFLKLLDKYLQNPSSLSPTTILALEDCQFLMELNLDLLSSSIGSVNKTNATLPDVEADDVQTWLSAILTNQQTCLDGLRETVSGSSVADELSGTTSNDTMLYSVSLALFRKGWVPRIRTWKPTRKHVTFRHGRLPFRMSNRTRAIYDSVTRRRLLQSVDDQITVTDIVTVSQDGSGNFTTISAAVQAAPNNTKSTAGYFLIYVTAGVYEEYVTIDKTKSYLFMIGDGINQTIITGNRSVVAGWTTFNSATFAVIGRGFVAAGITFRNTAGAINQQAVAVRNDADTSTFYLCSFEGYQDTLYARVLRQFYRECDIYGTVDYIFGNAAAVFQNCNIYPRLALSGQFNTITAQGRTDPNQNTGTSIQNCTITAAADLASSKLSTPTFLGRPWKVYSLTVYMQNFMGSLIDPAGWHIWDGSSPVNTLYYAEYNNTGPGSNTSYRVTWPGYHVINATDAANFTVSTFLLGDAWLTQTGVPYTGALL